MKTLHAKTLLTLLIVLPWILSAHGEEARSWCLAPDAAGFVKHIRNIFTCLDADTGEVLYTEKRLEGITNVYASPAIAGDEIFVRSDRYLYAISAQGSAQKEAAVRADAER